MPVIALHLQQSSSPVVLELHQVFFFKVVAFTIIDLARGITCKRLLA